MRRTAVLLIMVSGLVAVPSASRAQAPPAIQSAAPAPAAVPAWVKRSNQYTQMLLDVQMEHAPEGGSREGLVKYDSEITDATRADEIVQRKELEAILAKLKKVEASEKDQNVREDLEIIQKTFDLQFRQDDYQLDHKVPFVDASAAVFGGLRILLDDQVAAERRPAAVIRLRKYAGVEPGYKPFTEVLKQRVMEQMAKPGVVYPPASNHRFIISLRRPQWRWQVDARRIGRVLESRRSRHSGTANDRCRRLGKQSLQPARREPRW